MRVFQSLHILTLNICSPFYLDKRSTVLLLIFCMAPLVEMNVSSSWLSLAWTSNEVKEAEVR